VLPVVAHQGDAPDPRIALRQLANDIPASVAAAVVDQDGFEAPGVCREHRFQAFDQQGRLASLLYAGTTTEIDGSKSIAPEFSKPCQSG
jgi:hypothetical protein